MACTQTRSLTQRDLQTIWHPFTQRALDPDPIALVKAKGSYLYTETGKAYLDGISSWWVNLHGHAHPHIAEAISKQCKELDQVLFTDFTHPNAIFLAEKLLELLPHFSRVFFSDNGSTAVECALKMVMQYWTNKKITKRKIISFAGGYHGDTFGAMSVAGKNGFNLPFWPYLFEVESLDPFSEECIEQLKQLIKDEQCACLIYEPLIQGVAGMRIYPKQRLNTLLELCEQAGIMRIADEVMTGFGRTSTLFASEQLTVQPDFICLSKGLTGGFLPMGVTLAGENIYKAFHSQNRLEAFLHGHSYTANPVICAAAIASMQLLDTPHCQKQRDLIKQMHKNFCLKHKDQPKLIRLECLGTILAIEFKGQQGYSATIRDHLIEHFHARQILLRPLGNVLYVLPPYCASSKELNIIYQAIEELWT